MKKIFIICSMILLLLLSLSAMAQETQEPQETPETQEEELPLAQRFPAIKAREQFVQYLTPKYYRFPPDTLFFEPLDLSYFPHEKWNKSVWALLGRWTDTRTYNQIIYTDTPAEQQIIHGTSTGETYGYLRNFYLYADLFVADNYPRDTGSCYVYYSNSAMTGFKDSYGILIDPQVGIYEVKNTYGGSRRKTYSQSSIRHKLKLIQEFDPEEFAMTPEEAEASSIGGTAYTQINTDQEFMRDWESLNSGFRMEAAGPVKAYRIEIIRMDGKADIYINGKPAASLEDKITGMGRDGEPVPDKVSWSYGPILYEGGLTTTCSIGNLVISGTGQREDLL